MHERRRRRRFPLRCALEFEKEGQTFSSSTLNISSQGFYCVVDQALAPGEKLHCRVDVMPGHTSLSLPGMSLNCHVVVIRSEPHGGGQGVACWIENYSVARRSQRRAMLQ
jgi:hypothetical protein